MAFSTDKCFYFVKNNLLADQSLFIVNGKDEWEVVTYA